MICDLSGIDLVDQVRVSDRPIDEPVRWLLGDARTLVMTQQVDFLWVRLLDVPSALTARRYAMPGEIVLEVIDEGANGFAAGRYRLRADGEYVECERTDRDPDIQMTQQALASIYLGGFRLTEMLLSGAARERTSGAVAQIDLMFSVPRPPGTRPGSSALFRDLQTVTPREQRGALADLGCLLRGELA